MSDPGSARIAAAAAAVDDVPAETPSSAAAPAATVPAASVPAGPVPGAASAAAAPPLSRPHRAGLLVILVLGGLTALPALSMDMYLPALPAVSDTLHTPAATVQLTL